MVYTVQLRSVSEKLTSEGTKITETAFKQGIADRCEQLKADVS
jgi:hypothetical protein